MEVTPDKNDELEDLPKPEPDKPEVNTPANEPATRNSQPETKPMEVHHHPQLEHKPKPWKEYLLEGLMIFLAVTMGYFAESYREHLSERGKEKEYVKSMAEDLKTDAAFLNRSINTLIPYHLTWLDSTVHLLQMRDLKGKDRQVYQAFMIGTSWTYTFHPTERTLSQLHSVGFQLIKNKNAANSISQLEAGYKQFNSQIATFVESMQNDIDISAYAFADRVVTDNISTTAFQNFADSNTVTLELSQIPESATINTSNTEAIQSYVEKLKKYSFYAQYGIKSGQIIMLREIKKTLDVLNKEYHLE